MYRFDRSLFTSLLAVASSLALLAAPASAEDPRFELELELGSAWQSRNDVQIPNDEMGTRFSLKDLAGEGPWLSARVDFTWNIAEKHGVRVLLAPFEYTEAGTLGETVRFAGETYQPDTPTEATYRFNSYRLTYRYRFADSGAWRWWVGFTGKVRDAKIELRQGDVQSRDTDVGFVPLLHLAGTWRFADRWTANLELDGLAGGPGRAIDLALELGYDVTDQWTVELGYRTLEGGADTDDVYNFAWFHSAVASVGYRF